MNQKQSTIAIKAITFDLGNVLIPWDIRRAYTPLFRDRDDLNLDFFLNNVCTLKWHTLHDQGMAFAENIKRRQQLYPEYSNMIAIFEDQWDNMFGDVNKDIIALLHHLHAEDYPLYVLSNIATDKFIRFEKKHSFMALFQDAIVSGEEKITKPDPRLYHILLQRTGVAAENMLFIDDRDENLIPAQDMGIQCRLFTTAEQLRSDLTDLGIL